MGAAAQKSGAVSLALPSNGSPRENATLLAHVNGATLYGLLATTYAPSSLRKLPAPISSNPPTLEHHARPDDHWIEWIAMVGRPMSHSTAITATDFAGN
jgi:hypothetical protein